MLGVSFGPFKDFKFSARSCIFFQRLTGDYHVNVRLEVEIQHCVKFQIQKRFLSFIIHFRDDYVQVQLEIVLYVDPI